MRLSARSAQWNPLWLAVPGLLLLFVFFVFPVARMLVLAVQDPDTGALGISQFERMLNSQLYMRVLWVTFRLAFFTTLLSLLIAYPLAYWIATLPARWRGIMLFLVLVPLWTSYLVKSFSWMLILGRTGILNNSLMGLGLIDQPLALLRTEGSVLVGMVHSMLPIAIITMIPVMEKVDRRLLSAAETLGSSSAEAFWRVFFPLSLPGVAAAGLLVFVYSLGFFIVPALLGGPAQSGLAQVIIAQIQQMLNWHFASALATVLLVTALICCVIYNRALGVTGGQRPGGRPDRMSRQLGRKVLSLLAGASHFITRGRNVGGVLGWYSALVLIFLILPTLIILPIGFTSSAFLEFPPPGYSLRWFQAVLDSPVWVDAITRTLYVAAIVAVVATVVGGMVALALARVDSRLNGAIYALFLAPLIVPRVVTALGMFYLFAQIGLVATDLGLIIGHTVIVLPFTLIAISAVLKSYDWRLDDAAATLGAGRFTVIRKITVPLTLGGIAGAFIFAFVTSLDELTVAIFISGGIKTTLPKQMWDDLIVQLNPTLASVSVIMTVIVTLMLILSELLRHRKLHKIK